MMSRESDPATPAFGSLLRRLRLAAALSQEELAERAGLSVRGLGDLERGVHQAPRLETVRLLADALQLGEQPRTELLAAARPELAGAASAHSSSAPRRAAVPLPLTRLIGRDAEAAALLRLLAQDENRLVTLTGPGGVGKTRLALAVAGVTRDRFGDGVHFIDLSPLTDADLVLPTIATSLGVPETSGGLADRLVGFFGEKRVLLVLDNVERLLAAAPAVVDLLTRAPGLQVLATSRIPLHAYGEREYPLPPLPFPDVSQVPPLAQVNEFGAIRLFTERAQAVLPEFALTASNAAAVTAICQRLDGLPLAIELAAARVKLLPPAALLTRLDNRLPLLTAGPHTLPARQRTMRDAIAWSYDLMAPTAQWLFRRLAVFAGGFTLTAAEAMEDPGREAMAFEGVAALVEHSLLRRTLGTDDEPRYLMLETVREFGLEQLAVSGEEHEARQRHAAHFRQLAGDLSHRAYGLVLRDRAHFSRLLSELDNVRLALAWMGEHSPSDVLLMTSEFWGLWHARGLYREGLDCVAGALRQSSTQASVARVRALDGAGTLAMFHGDYSQAAVFYDEQRTLAQELGDRELLAMALCNCGLLISRHGEYAQAEALFHESQRLLHSTGDAALEGMAILWIGDMTLVQAQYGRAAMYYQEALERFQATGFDWGLADVRAGLGGVSYCTGSLAAAAAHYGEGLDRAWQIGVAVLALGPLLGLAGVAAESGYAAQGARLCGAAEGITSSLGAPIFPRDRPARGRALGALAATLGDDELAAARADGRALTFGQAVAEAKSIVARVAAAAHV